MSFLESIGPDITESVPTHISARPAGSPVYVDLKSGILADIAIDNLPFRLQATDDTPYLRETAESQRQQIDTSKEPGEQTLAAWWVRTLDSWHRGAGIRWYEPGTDEKTVDRYDRSVGLDVWTKGQVTLLRRMINTVTATAGQVCYATGARVAGTDVIFGLRGSTFFRHDGTTQTNYTGSAAATEPVVAGSMVLAGSTAGILSGSTTGTSLSALWTSTTGAVARPWWVKSRIIAARANKLYELTLAGGSLDSATALYTHPSTTFVWTGVTETANAILAAGSDGGYGYVFRISITDPGDGGTPILGVPVQVADFPPGEEVYSIKCYLSQYLAIGTSRGVRIGVFDSDSSFQYGPLIVETTLPVRAFGARGSFIYAAIEADIDGRSGCARIDLSETVDDLRYAWAYDGMASGAGVVQAVTFLGVSDRLVLGVQGSGIFLQSPTLYETTGYFTTGRVRYGTAEPKTFTYAKIRADISDTATVQLYTIAADDSQEFIVSLGGSWNTDEDITLKTVADRGQGHASVKLILNASADGLTAPTILSVQLKALPQPRIQRNIRYPLKVEDVEEDRRGNKYGKNGDGATRLFALEALEQSRAVVTVTDFRTGEAFSAQIRTISFEGNTPPSRNRTNFGGIAQVTVLKL